MLIKKMWISSPSDVVNFIKKNLIRKQGWDYSIKAVLNNQKHMDICKLIDRWERYRRVIENKNQDNSIKNFSFSTKNIMELGCGPIFGWGPIALFQGASQYYYYDPSLVRDVAESRKLKEKYFIPLYKELVSNYGNRMNFEEFYEKILTQCMPISFNKSENVDIILSNSVLEHIPRNEIQSVLSALFMICKKGGYFFHAVDFGSHGIGGNGFGSLYTKDATKGFEKLNLLRKSDIENFIANAGFQLLHSTIYRAENINFNKLHPTFREYSEEDITSKVVFYVGKKIDR